MEAQPVAQGRIATELQMQVWQDVPFIPMGEYWQTTAYRKGLTGIIPGCPACCEDEHVAAETDRRR